MAKNYASYSPDNTSKRLFAGGVRNCKRITKVAKNRTKQSINICHYKWNVVMSARLI